MGHDFLNTQYVPLQECDWSAGDLGFGLEEFVLLQYIIKDKLYLRKNVFNIMDKNPLFTKLLRGMGLLIVCPPLSIRPRLQQELNIEK